ncbi:hypothetical protein evm_000507 [Chilo suppressalis]|nr:hypothetical protein evm_000507 [Chilo suppressalis]
MELEDGHSLVQKLLEVTTQAFLMRKERDIGPTHDLLREPSTDCSDLHDMLKNAEEERTKRECTGRGQLDREWQRTVKAGEISLRKVPHYGMTEFCTFNRQLSETRTRVELMTSCWLNAAVYVNNNFVVQSFLGSEDTYEEMLMMSHACLTRIACHTLLGTNNQPDIDPTLRAARHARQIQDVSHATELYLQHVVNQPRGANGWRELSTCLMDVDIHWANVCINKSLVLDPRHRLSLLSKACKLYDEDPEAAEMFFQAIVSLFPFWSTGWVVANVYYVKRKLFHMADQAMKYMKKTMEDGLSEHLEAVGWAQELGDWWDTTPLLPGMNPYYIATDLLLRLRSFTLAEVCLSRGVAETGETALFYHLLALCCRLRGDIDEALCHLQLAIDKFGNVIYLRALQAECYHKKKNYAAAMGSYEKSGSSLCAYSILLSLPCWEKLRARSILLDLIRRQPSAYAWVALAEDWLQQTATAEGGDAEVTDRAGILTCAAACAVQALKWDRQAGRAWALLSRLVAPSARRKYCLKMAQSCDYEFTEKRNESSSESQQSLCYRLGKVLRDCRCFMCEHFKI